MGSGSSSHTLKSSTFAATLKHCENIKNNNISFSAGPSKEWTKELKLHHDFQLRNKTRNKATLNAAAQKLEWKSKWFLMLN